jgi:hypothetical protein
MRDVKKCPGCNRHLRVVITSSAGPREFNRNGHPVPTSLPYASFNRKLGTPDGLQPYCRTCDWNGKATLEEAWNRLCRVLDGEPQSAALWTMQMYFDLLGCDPSCNWCGSSCREWGIGHWIDRQSSDYGHIPSNCVVCCTPCNMHKGHKPYSVHDVFLRGLLKSSPEFSHGRGPHPWGKIPWDLYPSSSREFRRVGPPDLSAFVVDDAQVAIAGDVFDEQPIAPVEHVVGPDDGCVSWCPACELGDITGRGKR